MSSLSLERQWVGISSQQGLQKGQNLSGVTVLCTLLCGCAIMFHGGPSFFLFLSEESVLHFSCFGKQNSRFVLPFPLVFDLVSTYGDEHPPLLRPAFSPDAIKIGGGALLAANIVFWGTGRDCIVVEVVE